MKVSVVVPTCNRAHRITGVLKALEKQSFRDFETIIVNDGSIDNTPAVIDEFSKTTSLKISVYSIPNKGRAGSRNFGVTKASGDLIVFFDDDTRPNPESVRHHLNCHLSSDKLLISGPYLYDHSKFQKDFSYFRQQMEAKWISETNTPAPCHNLRINGGNMSIRKVDFFLAGGFDERLRDKEDFKLSYDFSTKCGGTILTFYATWVYHDDFGGLLEYIKRERASRLEEQKLLLLDPRLGTLFPERFQLRPPVTIKYLLGRTLRIKGVVALLDKILNSRLIAWSLRQKIYDWIITMNVKYP